MKLRWQHKEEIARRWLSKELGIKLTGDIALLGDVNGELCSFQFDILPATHHGWDPNKEIKDCKMDNRAKDQRQYFSTGLAVRKERNSLMTKYYTN